MGGRKRSLSRFGFTGGSRESGNASLAKKEGLESDGGKRAQEEEANTKDRDYLRNPEIVPGRKEILWLLDDRRITLWALGGGREVLKGVLREKTSNARRRAALYWSVKADRR